MRRPLRVVLTLSGSFLLYGCGGGGGGTSTTPPPPPATHFSVVPAQANETAGTAFNITVTALDASNNVANSYGGTVRVTSSDAQAVFSPASSTLTNGTGSFSATLKTAGMQTITATDTVNASISGVSSSIIVSAGAATSLSVSAPAAAAAGTSFNFTVTALDAWSNLATGYSGTVHFTSTDGQAVLPANSTLPSGTATFSATLKTAGPQTITATDTVNASISGVSSSIIVSGPATHFSVNAPATATSGTSFNFTVTALDALNDVAASYTGTVHFSSSDVKADLPPDHLMTSGNTTTFPAGLKTSGPQEITVTDTVTAITGTSKPITVSAAVAANPVPFINQPLSPETVEPGGGNFLMKINGTGFVSGTKVEWNGNPRATTFISNSTLTATVLASDISIPNTASVTVVNPAPGGGVSNVLFFEATLPTTAIALSTSPLSAGSSPATGDFNHDGKLDLVVANGNNVSVLLGNGDGTFQPAVNYVVGSSPDAVAVGDFNHDGNPDLAVANNGSNNVSILLGNGDGTFQPAVNYSVPSCCPTLVALGDFNGDGKLDLAVSIGNPGGMGPGIVSIFLGNGDGTFQAALNYVAGSDPYAVAVGDFNGDGRLDLVVTDTLGNNVGVLLGNGDGTFQPALDFGVGGSPISVVVADFNGDGILDLAVASLDDLDVSVLLGNGDGTFQSAVNYGTGLGSWGLVAGDFNGDGKLDLALPDFGQSIGILLGNGDGTFQPVMFQPIMDPVTGSSVGLAAGDFDGQGRLDLAAANSLLLQSTLVPSMTNLTFPVQVLQSGSMQTLTLTNVSAQTLNISGVAVTGANAGDFTETDNCGSPLPLGATCTVSVTFTPTQIGPRNASVSISDNGVGSPQAIPLIGTGGFLGPNATLSSASLTFGEQTVDTTSQAQSITLSNFGTMPLTITSILASTNFGESNNCNSTLESGANCTVGVTFTPGQTGNLTGTLSLTDNAANSPQMISISGTGVSCQTKGEQCYGGHACCPGLQCVAGGDRAYCESVRSKNTSRASSFWDRVNANK